MNDITAQTITLDGVTSNPGKPITMARMACGCHPFLTGHISAGVEVYCPDCEINATIDGVLHTWVF